MRMRVQTREGVLVVYDAAAPTVGDPGCSGYIGYWWSALDKTEYIFPAILQEEGDLAAMLLALERDLGVDLEALARRDDRIDEALSSLPETPNDDIVIVWEPATLHRAVEIMGFDPEIVTDLNEGSGDQTAMYCEPCMFAGIGPPRNCGSPEGLAREGLTATVVCCEYDGGGDPPDDGGDGGPGPGQPQPCGHSCCAGPCNCTGDKDCDGIPNGDDPDVDGDRIPNGSDPDVDGDYIPNGADDDIDGGGDGNSGDPDPDGDGLPNAGDPDDDGDSIPDVEDPTPGGCTGTCCGSPDPCCGVICNDDNECTDDSCNPSTGLCVNQPKNCDDEDPCTDDWCDQDTGCRHRSVCDDDDACTIDCCDPDTLDCTYAPVCDDQDACTQDFCNAGTCTHVAQGNDTVCFDECRTGICQSGLCVGDPACPQGTQCCEDLCCPGGAAAGQGGVAAAACAACCDAGPCDTVNCDDGNPCTWDHCNAANGTCIHSPRVNLEIRASNKALPDGIENDLPGQIMCMDSDAKVEMRLKLQHATKSLQGCGYGDLRLEASPDGVVGVFGDAGLTNAISLPADWTPPHNYPASVWLKALTEGTVTLTLTWTTNCFACSDSVKVTTRPLWTNAAFPQMTFDVTGEAPQVNLPSIINTQQFVGWGAAPPQAIVWTPSVDVQVNGNHVSCDQFLVGIFQNMLTYNGTFTYGDGTRVFHGTWGSLDQYKAANGQPEPGPDGFYRASSTKHMSACGSTGALAFEDTPYAFSSWFNSCLGHNQALQSISFQDSLETWLVARHNPSGCYTVLKHFTWNQSAQTQSVNAQAHQVTVAPGATTNVGGVDDGPGQTAVRGGTPFNQTTGEGTCAP